jgi:CPA2 family monovalent cation:H+ antiporter-2
LEPVLSGSVPTPLADVDPSLAAGTGDVAFVIIALGIAGLVLSALVRIARQTGISPIPFYLVAGLVLGAIGPFELSEGTIELGSNIGVVLLLFMLGLEYSSEELSGGLKRGIPAGVLDLVLNFTPGFVIGLLLGWEPVAALLLGGITYISSSGIIAKLLADLDRLGNRETPSILSILVIEDLAMAVYLPLIAALLVGGTVLSTVGSLVIAVAAAAAALVIALRFGHQISRAIDDRSDEAVLLATGGLILAVAGFAEELGVSAAVGAFLVGVALSGEVAERARILLTPLRDLFAAIFFVFFGLGIELGSLTGVLAVAMVLAVITAITKLVTGWWAASRAGVGPQGRGRAAAALVARGEFSIIIAGIGVAAGSEADLGPLAAAYVLILALAGPIIARSYGWLVPIGVRLGELRVGRARTAEEPEEPAV